MRSGRSSWAWFLLSAARSEEVGGLIRQALSGISVAEVMTPDPVRAPDNITVEDAPARLHPGLAALDFSNPGRNWPAERAPDADRAEETSRRMLARRP